MARRYILFNFLIKPQPTTHNLNTITRYILFNFLIKPQLA